MTPPDIIHSRRGAVLLLVLWAIVVLSMSVHALLQTLELDAERTALEAKRFKAWQMARSGLAYAFHPDIGMDSPALTNEMSDGTGFEVKVSAEAAKLNINVLLATQNLQTLDRLFEIWGVKMTERQQLMDVLLDWVDTDDLRRINGAEKTDYLKAGLGISPRNGYFQSVGEMALVLGVAPILDEAHPAWREAFTIHGKGQVDVNRAPADVLRALMNLNEYQAQALIDRREAIREMNPEAKGFSSLEEIRMTADIGEEPFKKLSPLLILDSGLKDITSTGHARGVKRTVRVVIDQAIGQQTPLLWEEN